jgi:hypothetical protein
MIDTLGLAISHGLILLAAWRLFFRPDLDDETGEQSASRLRRKGRPGA